LESDNRNCQESESDDGTSDSTALMQSDIFDSDSTPALPEYTLTPLRI